MAYSFQDELETFIVDGDSKYEKAIGMIKAIQETDKKGVSFADSIEKYMIKNGSITRKQYDALVNIVGKSG